MKSVYTLGADAIYKHTKPLFGTWTLPSAADWQGHNYTIIQNPDGNSSSDEEAITFPTSSLFIRARQGMLAELYCFGLSIRLAVPQSLRLLLSSL